MKALLERVHVRSIVGGPRTPGQENATLVLAAKYYRCLLLLCCLCPCSPCFFPGFLLGDLGLSEGLADKLLHRPLRLHISGRSRIAHQKPVDLKMRGDGGEKRSEKEVDFTGGRYDGIDVLPGIGRHLCKEPHFRR